MTVLPAGQPDLHPALEPLAFLLGTWRGEGRGAYPTIEPFAYLEEITFRHNGRPVLIYEQRTRHPETGAPMHGELGYWRPAGEGRVEIVLAHPTGISEIYEGTLERSGDSMRVHVATTVVARTSTAKDVVAMSRTFDVAGDVLTYLVRMEAVGVSLTDHLRASLRRG